MREVNSYKLSIVEDYVDINMDLEAFAKELGFKVVGGVMSCPFHGSDSTPSLRINNKQWKCFGCGRGGGYLKFREEINKLENPKATYYDTVEKVVMETQEISALVGGSIYKSTKESIDDRWERTLDIANSKAYVPKKVKVQSYDRLIQKARNMDTDTKVKLLSAIQEDLPFNIVEAIVNGTDLTGKSLFDLAIG